MKALEIESDKYQFGLTMLFLKPGLVIFKNYLP